jgi:rubrerythrin
MSIATPETILEVYTEPVTEKKVKNYVHIVNPPANKHIQQHADMAMTAKEIVEYARRNGLEVVCLCGYRFIPTRNPEAVNDTCPICIDVAGMLMRNSGE